MRVRRVLVAAGMTLRELSRGRVALGLAAAVPLLFFVVAGLVSSDRDITVRLAAAPGRIRSAWTSGPSRSSSSLPRRLR